MFGLTATFVAFFVNTLDSYVTTNYLDQRGMFLTQSTTYGVTQAEGNKLIDAVRVLKVNYSIQDAVLYRYFDVGNNLRIFSLNLSNPWLNPWINPSLVIDGSFPSSTNQALIPYGDVQVQQSNGVFISSTVAVGSKFSVWDTPPNATNAVPKVSFTVSGLFDGAKFGSGKRNSLWVFVPDFGFDKLIAAFGISASNVYVYSASITVKTQNPIIPSSSDYDHVADLKQKITDTILNQPSQFGKWVQVAQSTIREKKEKSNLDLSSFFYGLIGGAVLVAMYSYLLSRLRSREVAILKAMGYSNNAIRLALIGEILTTSLSGFIVGILSVNGILIYLSLQDLGNFRTSALLRWESILASFLIVVLFTLIGILIVTWKALRVSPMNLFRDR